MPGSGNHAENALQKALRIVLAMLPRTAMLSPER